MGAVAGQPWVLFLNFYNEAHGGILTDPASVQLDITYGGEVGLVADFAGPFTWTGATSFTPGQIWRIGTGQFAFSWSIPPGASAGTYTANWSCEYSGALSLGVENFYVTGGAFPAPAPADTGYWTGSITYTPDTSINQSVYAGASVPLGGIDSNGIAWLLNKVEGWDGCDIQGAGVIPKSGDHGGYPAPQFYAPRALTLTITAMAASQALRDVARSTLAKAVPISDFALFTYNEPIAKCAMVRRAGKITETYADLLSVQFSVLLIAPDPRKYGAVQKTAGPVTPLGVSAIGWTLPFTLPLVTPPQPPSGAAAVTNAGDFETRPLITISGPIDGPSLQNVNTGQVVSWSQLNLPAGDQLVADFNARTGFINGGYVPADVFSSWWVMPAGNTTIQLAGTPGTGASMLVSYSDAYQ